MSLNHKMFIKTRFKIFFLILIIAFIIITLMLSIIYFSSVNYNFSRSMILLEHYIESYNKMPMHDMNFDFEKDVLRPYPKDNHNKMFNLTTFYSVFYDSNDNLVKVNLDKNNLYEESEIIKIANDIKKLNNTRGIYNNLPFIVNETKNGKIIALLDNTFEIDNSNKLFQYSLIAGVTAFFLIAILSFFFSKRIVNPLEQNNQKQLEFICDASHELKTPISIISANSELLSLELKNNKYLENIEYETTRMSLLVKQLLELAKSENAKFFKENVDFSFLVNREALTFESVAFEKNLTLDINIKDNIFIEGNKQELEKLVSILIDNAIEHSKDENDIKINLNSTKNHAILSIINSGKAIDESVKSRLFERFYKEDEARVDKLNHYGLGLAIAKAVVLAHKGKIEVLCNNDLVEFRVTFVLAK